MTNIQNARIDAHVHSLELDQDLQEILGAHATNEEVKDIRDRIEGIV